jgi:signal peptidase II
MTFLAAVAQRRAYFLSAALVVALDQGSKLLADAFVRGRGAIEVIPGLLNLWYSRNRGGLFGAFAGMDDPWRVVLLTGFPVLAVIAISVFLAKTDEPDRSTLFGLAMILGGATGNLIDRVLRGSVVDFLDVYASQPKLAGWLVAKFGTVHWPTFNVADAAIVLGAFLLILDIFRPEPRPDEGARGR